MVQPIRPQDVSNVYRQQAASMARGTRPGIGVAAAADASGVNAGSRSDRVMLSDEALQLRRVLDSIADHPELREQRISELRDQIANGTYDRGFTEVASRLVEDGIVQ